MTDSKASRTVPSHRSNGAPPAGSNGASGPPRLAVAPPKGRLRIPELAIGLFVMIGFALAAVLWHLNSVDKTPALAVALSVERGETIRAEDIRVVYRASDEVLARLDESQMS